MVKYLFRRMIIGMVTVFFIISIVFFALRLLPGDPVSVWLGEYSTPELVTLTNAKWGLDQPIWVQYGTYVKISGYVFVISLIPLPIYLSVNIYLGLSSVFILILFIYFWIQLVKIQTEFLSFEKKFYI